MAISGFGWLQTLIFRVQEPAHDFGDLGGARYSKVKLELSLTGGPLGAQPGDMTGFSFP